MAYTCPTLHNEKNGITVLTFEARKLIEEKCMSMQFYQQKKKNWNQFKEADWFSQKNDCILDECTMHISIASFQFEIIYFSFEKNGFYIRFQSNCSMQLIRENSLRSKFIRKIMHIFNFHQNKLHTYNSIKSPTQSSMLFLFDIIEW